MNPVVVVPKSASLNLVPIRSITLQAKDGITITSDSDGIVKTWDNSTGLCKASFQTPAEGSHKRDVQLINGRLIIVWSLKGKICIWNVEKEEVLLEVNGHNDLEDLRISGDGSRFFSLGAHSIYAWSVQTGEIVDKVAVGPSLSLGSLTIDGSKVWTYQHYLIYQGWDFGIPGSSPAKLSNNTPTLANGSMLWDPRQARIKNAVTGEVVFQLSGRFVRPVDVQCDGSYLVAGYESGEILIVDLK